MLPSKRDLMKQLDAIQHAVNEARGKTVSRPTTVRIQPQDRVGLGRLFVPGQVVRFPTQASWEEFRLTIPGDAYEIIDHTDPLGFDGGTGVVIDGSANPLNFLRRNQLPNKTIDMTNVYKPSVLGRVPTSVMRRHIIPFLGYRNGQYYPDPFDGIPSDIASRPLPTEQTVSVLQPRLFTYKEVWEYLQSLEDFQNVGFFTSVTANVVDSGVFLFGPPDPNVNIPQSEDCSAPTVGCFWFNDGRNGQLELPKDPACRACIVIRFKKYALV